MKVATSEKVFHVKINLGIIKILRCNFSTVYRRPSFSAIDIIISKKEEICGPKVLMMEATISFLRLKVWLFGG